MARQSSAHRRISRTSALHYLKLVYRSALFLTAAVLYLVNCSRNTDALFDDFERQPVFLTLVWLIFVTEMIFRFFPSKIESMGCQKQFACNYQATSASEPVLQSSGATWSVAAAWILLNAAIAALYFMHIIDQGILLLISLAYSVCDMICILFFCPFQAWFMKNKCCTSCRIYNWDYAMMFTPLMFVRKFYAQSLFVIALILLVKWEIMVKAHPERFSEATNRSLSCAVCTEKLCHHKRQLRRFLSANAHFLHLKGNQLLDLTRHRKNPNKE